MQSFLLSHILKLGFEAFFLGKDIFDAIADEAVVEVGLVCVFDAANIFRQQFLT